MGPVQTKDEHRRAASRLSLRATLAVPYVVLVVGLVTIAALSYRTFTDAIDTASGHLLEETVGRIGQAVAQHVAASSAALEAAFPVGVAGPRDIDAELPELRRRLWVATSLQPSGSYVYYANQQGQFVGLWRHSKTEGELRLKLRADQPRKIYRFVGIDGALQDATSEARLFDPRKRPWYRAGRAAASDTWTPIDIDFRTEALMTTRARRVPGPSGDDEGVVATDVSLHGLDRFLRELRLPANGLAFIVDADGHLIATSSTSHLADAPDGAVVRRQAAHSGDHRLSAVYRAMAPRLAEGIASSRPLMLRVDGNETLAAAGRASRTATACTG